MKVEESILEDCIVNMVFKNLFSRMIPSFHLSHQYHHQILFGVDFKIRTPRSMPTIASLTPWVWISIYILNDIECKTKAYGVVGFVNIVTGSPIFNTLQLVLCHQLNGLFFQYFLPLVSPIVQKHEAKL